MATPDMPNVMIHVGWLGLRPLLEESDLEGEDRQPLPPFGFLPRELELSPQLQVYFSPEKYQPGSATWLWVNSNLDLQLSSNYLSAWLRVRGFWPFLDDRPITTRGAWQPWIDPAFIGPRDEPQNEDEDDNEQDGLHNDEKGNDTYQWSRLSCVQWPAHDSESPPENATSATSGTLDSAAPGTITLTNPFTNPVALETFRKSFAAQPNWKASLMEGETWEVQWQDGN
ncbi:hypothetical protein B0H10DRAFT_1951032 [Mycena sp. CBHHK59/15]|nr:hypothetical protein B0H10DRAFT_1951032 [Mycena sp. CBHHK59/15]